MDPEDLREIISAYQKCVAKLKAAQLCLDSRHDRLTNHDDAR
jgi:hypothetical protein